MSKKIMKSQNVLRSPIVTVLGHVDHGKTTLLDFIRKTNVVKKEVGGITQGMGASTVKTKDGKQITFVDTPGHAAFAKMRARGAKIADIAILVVAADDGVKPQTKEALEYILSTKTPFIVVITKTDLVSASVDNVKTQLEKEGVHFEDKGGEIPSVAISAKKGEGVDELIEIIVLVSELNEIIGNEKNSLDAVVVETSKTKAGPIVDVVVRDGILEVGDEVIAGGVKAKIKGLFGEGGDRKNKIKPGEPVQVLGFSELPVVGSKMVGVDNEATVGLVGKKSIVKLDINKGKYPILVKAKSAGTLEALISNLPGDVALVSSGVGGVTESDIFMAKTFNAQVYVFEARVPSSVSKLAKTEGVIVHRFDIIYELFEKIQEIIEGDKKQILGKAEIVQLFPYNKKKVAGCKVIEGVISKDNSLDVMRNEKKLGSVRIVTMKREKQKIREAKQGEDCGIVFTPQLEFAIGDMLLSIRKKK